jgi:hypothetical protein
MAKKKTTTKRKGAATKAKPGARKLLARPRVDFTKLHMTMDALDVKLNQALSTTGAPKIRKILAAMETLRKETNCQLTMVIQF